MGGVTTLNNGVSLTLLRLDKVPAPETFLSPSELEKFASFKIEKRRRDWLGGRYAAKTTLKEALCLKTPLTAIEISYDPSGRPIWAGGEIPHLLSITHSGPFCAAAGAAGTSFFGIDLEKAEPRAEAWYKDYFYKDELSLVTGHRPQVTSQTQDIVVLSGQWPVASQAPLLSTNHYPQSTIQRATLLWTQKEALLKALGLGLKADLLDINLAGDAPEFLRTALKRYEDLGKPTFNLATFEPEPGWYLSMVCETAPNLLK